MGAWYTIHLKRPKLVVSGTGGSQDQQFAQMRVRVTNWPGLLGVRLNKTVVLGKLIHRRIGKGLTVDRNAGRQTLTIDVRVDRAFDGRLRFHVTGAGGGLS